MCVGSRPGRLIQWSADASSYWIEEPASVFQVPWNNLPNCYHFTLAPNLLLDLLLLMSAIAKGSMTCLLAVAQIILFLLFYHESHRSQSNLDVRVFMRPITKWLKNKKHCLFKCFCYLLVFKLETKQ